MIALALRLRLVLGTASMIGLGLVAGPAAAANTPASLSYIQVVGESVPAVLAINSGNLVSTIVSGSVSGSMTAAGPATAASTAPAAVVSVAEPGSGGPEWALILGGLAVFLGLLVIGGMAISPVFTTVGSRRLRNMDQYVSKGSGQGSAKSIPTPSAISEQILGLSEKLTRERESTAKTAILLERADLAFRTNEWFVLQMVSVVVTTAAAWLMLHDSMVAGLFATIGGVIMGFFAPRMFLSFKANRRARKFETQLPDVLTLLASSLATGFSLAQGIDAIVRDASEPSAKEFSRALAETRIGATLEDTLEHLAERMGSENLRWTTMAIRIQRQVGGNLAETLRTTATTLRDREALKRQVRGLSAEGRLSAYILFALPFGLFFYMFAVNRPYVSLLWTNPIGWVMLGAGGTAMVVGAFWMRSVVTVEV